MNQEHDSENEMPTGEGLMSGAETKAIGCISVLKKPRKSCISGGRSGGMDEKTLDEYLECGGDESWRMYSISTCGYCREEWKDMLMTAGNARDMHRKFVTEESFQQTHWRDVHRKKL